MRRQPPPRASTTYLAAPPTPISESRRLNECVGRQVVLPFDPIKRSLHRAAADGMDVRNDGGVRIQASGGGNLQGVGVLRGGTMVVLACSWKKTRKDEREKKQGRRRETRGGTAG